MNRTLGADIGYSSGKNSSNLKTPPSNGEPSGPMNFNQYELVSTRMTF